MARVFVLGLDGLEPTLVFGALAGELPTLQALRRGGGWGPLRSCVPPITVPAWACMVTSQDPGQLGVYGFRGRGDRRYEHGARLASSLSYAQPPLWTLLSRAGRRCFVIGVPQTHPPKPVRGRLVSDVVTPPGGEPFTYPPELSAALRAGAWRDEPADFRRRDVDAVLAEVAAVSAQRLTLARTWLAEPWDFFMLVDMTPDRAHHVAWTGARPGEIPARVAAAYRALDTRVGALVAALREDDVLLIVSDHGGQPLRGCFALNDWLRQRGELVLRGDAEPGAALDPRTVDWPRTRAWAEGGYVGRVYLNICGREPQGALAPAEVDGFVTGLRRELEAVGGPDGAVWQTRTWRPAELYREARGVPPDLLVALDDLRWRALGTIGHPELWLRDNDQGPDGANHAWDGVVILRDGRGPRALHDATLFDIAPTVLDRLGVPIPPGWIGRPLG